MLYRTHLKLTGQPYTAIITISEINRDSNRQSLLKITRRHAEFISASHMQVSRRLVCNRQAAALAGVNIQLDTEVNSA